MITVVAKKVGLAQDSGCRTRLLGSRPWAEGVIARCYGCIPRSPWGSWKTEAKGIIFTGLKDSESHLQQMACNALRIAGQGE